MRVFAVAIGLACVGCSSRTDDDFDCPLSYVPIDSVLLSTIDAGPDAAWLDGAAPVPCAAICDAGGWDAASMQCLIVDRSEVVCEVLARACPL